MLSAVFFYDGGAGGDRARYRSMNPDLAPRGSPPPFIITVLKGHMTPPPTHTHTPLGLTLAEVAQHRLRLPPPHHHHLSHRCPLPVCVWLCVRSAAAAVGFDCRRALV